MPIEQFKYGIVGFGISGQLLVCELLKRNIPSKDIVILDKTFLGGALATEYGSVLSNTQWWKTKKALKHYESWSIDSLSSMDQKVSEQECTPVRSIAKACFETAKKASKEVERKTTTVHMIEKTTQGWAIQHSYGKVLVEKLFLCPGGVPKSIQIDLPQIPLEIALDILRLHTHVSKEDTVLVFGTSHSGTICLDHLHALGISAIGVYKDQVPFTFADEGAYSGLKEESAVIARKILAGKYPNISLISWSDTLKMMKSIQSATKYISATGFLGNSVFGADYSAYDPATGKVSNQQNLYGFGMAYPGISVVDGKTHIDVSVLSFQDQIQRCLPAILLE